MLGHFQTLLEGIAAAPDQCLKDLPLLTAEQQLMVEWNDTTTDYPKINVSMNCLRRRNTRCCCISFEDQQLTYRQLNQRANQLAHYLRRLLAEAKPSLGVESEVLGDLHGAIALDGSWAFRHLKAGGAYVP